MENAKVAKEIMRAYKAKLSELPSRESLHFTRRAYRVTGDKDFAKDLKRRAVRRTVPSIKKDYERLVEILEGNAGYPEVKEPSNTKNLRIAKRQQYFYSHPEAQFFRRFLQNLFHAKSMGLHEGKLKNHWADMLGTLQSVDFDNIYLDKEAVFSLSSYAINSAYFIDFLGFDESFKNRFIDFFKSSYFDSEGRLSEALERHEYVSLIYSLTHIIIGESRFYQRHVEDQLWVNRFFADNIDEILKKCGFDVIAEVGLCIKLAGQERKYYRAYDKVVNHVFNGYDWKLSIEGELFIKREHTNCVLLLLLIDNKRWYPGPLLT